MQFILFIFCINKNVIYIEIKSLRLPEKLFVSKTAFFLKLKTFKIHTFLENICKYSEYL